MNRFFPQLDTKNIAHRCMWTILLVTLLVFTQNLITTTTSIVLLVQNSVLFSVVIGVAGVTGPVKENTIGWKWSYFWLWLFLLACCVILLQLPSVFSIVGWLTLLIFNVLLIGTLDILRDNQKFIIRFFAHMAVYGTASIIPLLLMINEIKFSEEEFYVFSQVGILGMYFVALYAIHRCLPPKHRFNHTRKIQPSILWITLTSSWILLSAISYFGYQRSFYDTDAPTVPGIAPASPNICNDITSSEYGYDGDDVFQELLSQIQTQAVRDVPEVGWIALASDDETWLTMFHNMLISEAQAGYFTEPAHSVKWDQYQASQRLYIFMKVDSSYPSLFTADERNLLREWFAAINKRAMTTEWVDWLYALAFTKLPEGPYENQDNGAGLLALLEVYGLADPSLRNANQNYLERMDRGWETRFRNTDDAYAYQLEWIENAFYQSLYSGDINITNARLSFEWLLLQAIPDGKPTVYNYPYTISPASVAYFGAKLLDDPRYLWWAGRLLEYQQDADDIFLKAAPYVEDPLDMRGESPAVGSCMLYGDTGLPNQIGPLAPDKIVFRDNWTQESRYLLLNLRFTGWHRYKATNTLSLVYQSGILLEDEMEGSLSEWLPEGRSLFRDKRIPRENLNGLVIGKSGISAAIAGVTGLGGPWSQDPPHYAEVVSFKSDQDMDVSHTRITNWNGWLHNRWVFFKHNYEPVLIVDVANGPNHVDAAITWHSPYDLQAHNNRFVLRSEYLPVEMLILPLGQGNIEIRTNSGSEVTVKSTSKGKLRLLTVLLFDKWVGASTELVDNQLVIKNEYETVVFDLPTEVSH